MRRLAQVVRGFRMHPFAGKLEAASFNNSAAITIIMLRSVVRARSLAPERRAAVHALQLFSKVFANMTN